MLLFGRAYRLTVDTVQITGRYGPDGKQGLDIAFRVSRTIKAEPNKCDLKIYNLTQAHRDQIAQRAERKVNGKKVGVAVDLEAGYGSELGLIFRGDLTDVRSYKDGPDMVTEISGSDGGNAWKHARISRSFPAGTTVATVIKAIVDAMGIGVGNAIDQTRAGEIIGLGRTFPKSTTLHGPCIKEMDRLMRGLRYEWSIQGGVLQVKKNGTPLRGSAVKLTPSTGLIGIPQIQTSTHADKKGKKTVRTIKATALLMATLLPGRKVRLESDAVTADLEVAQVDFAGEFMGGTWDAGLELRPYG